MPHVIRKIYESYSVFVGCFAWFIKRAWMTWMSSLRLQGERSAVFTPPRLDELR